MEDFEQSLKDVLIETFDTLNNKSIEVDSIVGLYYIKLYLNDNSLSNENKFIVDRIFFLLQKDRYEKYFSSDIRFLIIWYLIRSIKDISLEKEIIEEFFSVYLVFDNFQNIIDNKDILQMIYPQDKLEEYLDGLYQAIRKRGDFFNLELIDKEKIIFKYHYITVMMYERNEKSFKKMYDNLYQIFLEAIERKDDEVIFYIYTPLQFSWNSISTTYSENKFFNDSVEKPLETYIKENMIEKNKIQQNNKKLNRSKPIKVAFLQERMINYSIFKVFYSLLKNLNEEENKSYEFIILNLNFTELGGSDSEVEKITKELGFEYINCHEVIMEENTPFYSVVTKSLLLRDLILEKEIDILIGMHSRPEYNFLFTTRTCPLQVYWSHGNYEYDIKEVDLVINHGTYVENINSNINLKLKFFSSQVALEHYDQEVDSKLISQIRELYPLKKLIMGVIGRLNKIDNNDYLNAIITIMQRNSNTIYLACGDGDKESIINKIEKIDQSLLPRFFFTGFVNAHIYGNIIDIWPDTFPHDQGNSRVEAGLKGCAIVIKQKKDDSRIPNVERSKILKKYNLEKLFPLKKIDNFIEFVYQLSINEELLKIWSLHQQKAYKNGYLNNKLDFYKLLDDL